MKTLLSISVLLALSVSFAQAPKNLNILPYHPYRKIANGPSGADRYYNLLPIYNWINAGRKGPCPMPAWISWYNADDPHTISSYHAISVLAEGVLVQPKTYSPYGGHETRPFFLKNYPNKDRLADGASFQFIALKTGTYQYNDAGGSLHTVDLYDYGIPYDPAQLAAERQRTNSPALNPQH